jgi:hypothetical protein
VANGENAVQVADTQENKPTDPRAQTPTGKEEAPKTKQPKFPTREEFDLWVRRANDGDRKAQDWLRKALDAYPELWRKVGDLASHAQLSLVNLISKGEWFLGEALKRGLQDLRESLEGSSPSPLEQLAVQRVVAAWANLYYVETVCLGVEGDLAERKYWLKKQDQANRQYLAATKSLMLVQAMQQRSAPAPPMASTSRFRVEVPSTPPECNGTGGNGHAGSSPVPAFGADESPFGQLSQDAGHNPNRIAAMVGAAR